MGGSPTRRFEPVVAPARPEDLEELVRLAGLALTHLDGKRGGTVFRLMEGRADPLTRTFGDDLRAASAGSAHVLLGHLGTVPVGYAVSRVRDVHGGSMAVVQDLYVEPEARGVGVGRALMAAVVQLARSDGCLGIDAETLPGDRATKNFFEGFGLVTRKLTVHQALEAGGT